MNESTIMWGAGFGFALFLICVCVPCWHPVITPCWKGVSRVGRKIFLALRRNINPTPDLAEHGVQIKLKKRELIDLEDLEASFYNEGLDNEDDDTATLSGTEGRSSSLPSRTHHSFSSQSQSPRPHRASRTSIAFELDMKRATQSSFTNKMGSVKNQIMLNPMAVLPEDWIENPEQKKVKEKRRSQLESALEQIRNSLELNAGDLSSPASGHSNPTPRGRRRSSHGIESGGGFGNDMGSKTRRSSDPTCYSRSAEAVARMSVEYEQGGGGGAGRGGLRPIGGTTPPRKEECGGSERSSNKGGVKGGSGGMSRKSSRSGGSSQDGLERRELREWDTRHGGERPRQRRRSKGDVEAEEEGGARRSRRGSRGGDGGTIRSSANITRRKVRSLGRRTQSTLDSSSLMQEDLEDVPEDIQMNGHTPWEVPLEEEPLGPSEGARLREEQGGALLREVPQDDWIDTVHRWFGNQYEAELGSSMEIDAGDEFAQLIKSVESKMADSKGGRIRLDINPNRRARHSDPNRRGSRPEPSRHTRVSESRKSREERVRLDCIEGRELVEPATLRKSSSRGRMCEGEREGRILQRREEKEREIPSSYSLSPRPVKNEKTKRHWDGEMRATRRPWEDEEPDPREQLREALVSVKEMLRNLDPPKSPRETLKKLSKQQVSSLTDLNSKLFLDPKGHSSSTSKLTTRDSLRNPKGQPSLRVSLLKDSLHSPNSPNSSSGMEPWMSRSYSRGQGTSPGATGATPRSDPRTSRYESSISTPRSDRSTSRTPSGVCPRSVAELPRTPTSAADPESPALRDLREMRTQALRNLKTQDLRSQDLRAHDLQGQDLRVAKLASPRAQVLREEALEARCFSSSEAQPCTTEISPRTKKIVNISTTIETSCSVDSLRDLHSKLSQICVSPEEEVFHVSQNKPTSLPHDEMG